jgi:hypothetical protein
MAFYSKAFIAEEIDYFGTDTDAEGNTLGPSKAMEPPAHLWMSASGR